MGRPFLTHETFVKRLENFGKGYYLRSGEYKGNRLYYDVVCPKHPYNTWSVLGSNLLANTTCPLCANEKQSNDRSFSHAEIVSMFKKDGRGYKIKEGDIYKNNQTLIQIVCPIHPDYEWVTRPLDVINEHKNCPMCIGQAPLSNDIIDFRLMGRNITRLSSYTGKSKDKMLFKCDIDGYEWSAGVSKVLNDASGCPKCSGSIKWTNTLVDDWLKENKPYINRMSDIKTASSQTKFKCTIDGYEWYAQFSNLLTKSADCPACSKNKHWNNELVDRWLVENNKTFKRITDYDTKSKIIIWKCDIDGTEWPARLSHILKRQECPECTGGGGFKVNEPGYLYYGKVITRHNEYFKIGISNRDPVIRLKETRHSIELIWARFFEKGIDARITEQMILNQFKHLVQTEHKFSGSTECFTEDIRRYINLDIVPLDITQEIPDNTNN